MNYTNPNDFWKPGDPDFYKGMSDEERIAFMICKLVGMVLTVLITILLCAMCTGCTTTQYIPVIEHHTDTLIQTKVQKDSIWLHDSIHVTEKGDTVRIEKWHTKYIEKQVHDTTYVSKTDTVPQPYPVIKEVERKRTTMDWVLMITGLIAILSIIIWLVNKVKRSLPGM